MANNFMESMRRIQEINDRRLAESEKLEKSMDRILDRTIDKDRFEDEETKGDH